MPNPETLEAVAARAATIAALREQVTQETSALRHDIIAADRDGHGRNEIARKAEGGLSRKLVLELLGATDLTGEVKQVLRSAGYDGTQFLLRAHPRPAITLGSDVGEYSGGESERRRVAEGIAATLAEAGIEVGDVDRLTAWEFTTLARKDARPPRSSISS